MPDLVRKLREALRWALEHLEEPDFNYPAFRAKKNELESLVGLEGQANAAQVSQASPSTPIVPSTAGLSAERIRSVLANHWLSGVHCHHAISPDDHSYDCASCACSEVNLPHRGTVGEAVGTWIEHVIALLGAEPGVPLIHGRAELDIREARIRKDVLEEAAQYVSQHDNLGNIAADEIRALAERLAPAGEVKEEKS